MHFKGWQNNLIVCCFFIIICRYTLWLLINARHGSAKMCSTNDVLQQRNIVSIFLYYCISQKSHIEKVSTYIVTVKEQKYLSVLQLSAHFLHPFKFRCSLINWNKQNQTFHSMRGNVSNSSIPLTNWIC